jgi:DNA-binding transcriptional LysR family regulator
MEDRLHKFAALVEAGSFTKGAAALHISQPALTTAMQKLERELKAELLVPGSRPLRTTEAGQAAYVTAKELAIQTANLTQQLTELAGHQSTARVGIIDSLADALIADRALFGDLQAKTKLVLTVHNSGQLIQALEQDELDIAFVVNQGRHQSALISSSPVGIEELALVVHSDLAPIYKNSISRGILPSFLSYNKGSTTERLIHNALTSQGIEPLVSLTSTSPSILLSLVLEHQGAAVLPSRMASQALATGQLVRLPDIAPIERPIVALWRRGKRLPTALHNLRQELKPLLSTGNHVDKK